MSTIALWLFAGTGALFLTAAAVVVLSVRLTVRRGRALYSEGAALQAELAEAVGSTVAKHGDREPSQAGIR